MRRALFGRVENIERRFSFHRSYLTHRHPLSVSILLHEPDLPSSTGTVSGVLVLKPRSEEESLELRS